MPSTPVASTGGSAGAGSSSSFDPADIVLAMDRVGVPSDQIDAVTDIIDSKPSVTLEEMNKAFRDCGISAVMRAKVKKSLDGTPGYV